MECPCCGAELVCHDYYFRGNYSAYEKGHRNSGFKKLGDIYKCTNSEGFETLEEVLEFLGINENEFEEYCNQNGGISWDMVTCDSECHNGNYYIDEQGDLHEGYPC